MGVVMGEEKVYGNKRALHSARMTVRRGDDE